MEVKTCLRDGHYTLVEFRAEGKGYVFLYDADQHSLFLGQETQAIDLIAFWQKHRRDETYCLPCELVLGRMQNLGGKTKCRKCGILSGDQTRF